MLEPAAVNVPPTAPTRLRRPCSPAPAPGTASVVPRPSSVTWTVSSAGSHRSSTATRARGPAYFTAFVSPSWARR